MTTNLAVVDNGVPAVTTEQVALIKTTIAKDATDTELQLFFYDCRRQGVHPLDKLIFFTKRSGKYTPITSIDFMRQRAAQTGECGGIDDAIFVGEPKAPSFAATVTVYRFVQGQRCAYTATARWTEYKPDQNDFMWQKMPFVMLAKCAEALALRKGFPQQLAGLYAKEELDQADTIATTAMPASGDANSTRRPSAARTITAAMQKRFFAVAHTDWKKDKDALRAELFRKFGVRETDKIASDRYDEICEYFKQPPTPVDPDAPF